MKTNSIEKLFEEINKKQTEIFKCQICKSFLTTNDKIIIDKNFNSMIVCDECFKQIKKEERWKKRFSN